MRRFRIGDSFDLDVGGSIVRGVVKNLYGLNNHHDRLWTVQIDGVDPGAPVPERAMRPIQIVPRHRQELLEADEAIGREGG